MHNRVEIAHEFAKAIKSDYILKIILFGSVARGDDTEESDIDILIVSNHPMEIDEMIADEVAWIMYHTLCDYKEELLGKRDDYDMYIFGGIKTKMDDLNATSLEAAVEMIKGTARSMGVTVAE